MPLYQELPQNSTAKYLLIDSRQLLLPKESLFFAIHGLHHNGHDFLDYLYKKGVRQFVVEENELSQEQVEKLEPSSIWEVKNSIQALQELALKHREKLHLPIIAVTGSNGKTIVKEWAAQVLSSDYHLFKSPKSYNSQIGVPLSVWQIQPHHTLAIVEAGISKAGEMAILEKIIQPKIGIFTTIGSAHDVGFLDTNQKIEEKLKLFKNVEIIIYSRDNKILASKIQSFIEKNPGVKGFSWSKEDDWIKNINFPFTDFASLENASHVATLLKYLNFSEEVIKGKCERLKSVPMRLELKEGINSCYIIDDTYNNDWVGMTLAVQFLNQQTKSLKKGIILSDIYESGIPPEQLVRQTAAFINGQNISFFIGIGEELSKYSYFFSVPSEFFQTVEEFNAIYDFQKFNQSVLLVKGARKFDFQRVVKRLEKKNHRTVLEINTDALVENFNYFREKLPSHSKVMAMVKAFGYGSGSVEVASILEFHGVDYLAVAYADEGVELRSNGISVPIMVMNPALEEWELLAQNRLEPELYSERIFKNWLSWAKKKSFSMPIHLKLDTGMHRLGFLESDVKSLTLELQKYPQIKVASIFSHLVATEDANSDDFTDSQIEKFKKIASEITKYLVQKPLYHVLNSAGIERFHTKNIPMDMVRLGIGLYGVSAKNENLQVVLTLKTIISQIKELESGQTVGYNRKGKLLKTTRIATIAIGYADGLDRKLSQGVGNVLINGELCPIVGTICMDMTMVDITNIEAKEGDEVIIFGVSPTVKELSAQIGTIPYEVFTQISQRVKRVYYSK